MQRSWASFFPRLRRRQWYGDSAKLTCRALDGNSKIVRWHMVTQQNSPVGHSTATAKLWDGTRQPRQNCETHSSSSSAMGAPGLLLRNLKYVTILGNPIIHYIINPLWSLNLSTLTATQTPSKFSCSVPSASTAGAAWKHETLQLWTTSGKTQHVGNLDRALALALGLRLGATGIFGGDNDGKKYSEPYWINISSPRLTCLVRTMP